jgi:small GTP-binding protein
MFSSRKQTPMIIANNFTQNADVNDYNEKFNVFIVGDGGVGKTSLLMRLVDNVFIPGDHSSREDSRFKTFEINGKNIQFRIWDINNDYRKHEQAKVYPTVRSDVLILIVAFDLTDVNAFNPWFMEHITRVNPCPTAIILVGTKADLLSKRCITTKQVRDFIDEKNLFDLYIETSAKDNLNVIKALESAVNIILEKRRVTESESLAKNEAACLESFRQAHGIAKNEAGFFSSTRIDEKSSLQDIVYNAVREKKGKRTRSREICLKLGWFTEEGNSIKVNDKTPGAVRVAFEKVVKDMQEEHKKKDRKTPPL